MAEGGDRQGYNHAEIYGAIQAMGQALGAKMDAEARERRAVESKLFDQIGGVKDDVAELASAVARLEGERAGESRARAATDRGTRQPARLSLPQKAWAWGGVALVIVGVLGGLGQALHSTVGAAVAAYRALSPPPGH